MKYNLRDYQAQAVKTGIHALRENRGNNEIIVLPTGAGKSLVVSGIADEMEGHTLVLQPSKEILEQNFNKIMAFGQQDVGIYSASFNSKKIRKITYATIGSIYRKPELFRHFEQIIMDECHFLNAKQGMYKTFFEEIQKPVLGLTATPYRLMPASQIGGGSTIKFLTRTRPRWFNKISHITQNKELFDRGYLCPIDYQIADYDRSQLVLNSTGADFTQASIKLQSKNVLVNMAKLIVSHGTKHNLAFTSFVDEADELCKMLNDQGVSAAIVTGETPADDRANVLRNFKNGHYRAVCNVGVLTTGFDFPELDHVLIGTPTNSLTKYYQMTGRGIRIAEGKTVTRVTDLCGNFAKFGRLEDFEIFEETPGYHRLRSGDKILTGIDLKSGYDVEKRNEKLQNTGIIRYGKFKGSPIANVPTPYLEWVVGNFDGGYNRIQAVDELKKRGVQNVR